MHTQKKDINESDVNKDFLKKLDKRRENTH